VIPISHVDQHIADFVLGLQWDAVPFEVRRQAHRCLLDLLACAVAGASSRVAGAVRRFSLRMGGEPDALVLGSERRLPLPWAVLVNAFATSALDADDGYRLVKGHPGAFVFPSALAAAEKAGSSGREFLEALIVGYEIGMRAGLASHAHYPYYHGSGSWGGLGACAAAARLLKTEPSVLTQALGVAGYHGAITPMMRGIDVPAMVKDGIGWGAMTGVAALLLAEEGFSGTPSLLAEPPAAPLVQTLGREFRILDLYFKRYACCRWAQPAIRGALAASRKHQVAPSAIARVIVRTFAEATRLASPHPRTSEEAQFSLPYPVAAALVLGRFGPSEVQDDNLNNAAVLDLASLVEMVAEPRFQEEFPAKALADVELVSLDGRHLRSGPVQAAGDPDDPLPETELEAKFFEFCAPFLPTEDVRHLRELALGCDGLLTLQPLLDILRRVRGR
jgi:2-methylcitrate dehydratase PrpD